MREFSLLGECGDELRGGDDDGGEVFEYRVIMCRVSGGVRILRGWVWLDRFRQSWDDRICL